MLTITTQLVSELNVVNTEGSNPSGIVQVGSEAYFTTSDGASGAELWKTDGTSAGTILVDDIDPVPTPPKFNI